MKKDDIHEGAEYAVRVGYGRQTDGPGTKSLLRATVTGWTQKGTGYKPAPQQVIVRLAEPLSERGYGYGIAGKDVFTLATRQVIAPWAAHEEAFALREKANAEAKELDRERKEQRDAARARLQEVLPEALQPSWLSAPSWFQQTDGGHLAFAELLAIVEAVEARVDSRGA